MDNTIFTLHPTTDAALNVLKDPRNANLLVRVDPKGNDDAASPGETSALSLTIDRAPKIGTNFVIGRHQNADIVLTDPAVSVRHCTISISDTGVPVLHEQSTNGTLINGKHCNHQSFEIQNGMQIDIRNASFDIRVPWRGDYQREYEYEARRANRERARTPLESLPSKSAPTHTVWEQTLGPYTLTNTFINSFKLRGSELCRTEIVRKDHSFFAAKRFNRQGLGQRELRAWRKISDHRLEHPNIIHLKEVLEPGPVLIMELLPLGNLAQISREKGTPVSHDIASSVMKQLLSALEYLHRLSIVHVSIQLENLLVFSEQPTRIKLTGFELSCCDGEKVLCPKSVCEAPELWERHYRGSVSPSIWEKILATRGYVENRPMPSCGSPVDVWDSGVVCSQLTLGKVPCYLDSKEPCDKNAADYVDLLLAARLESYAERSKTWAQKLELSSRSIPPLLLSFLQKLLDPESESRAKAEDCLVDAWLTQDAQDPKDDAKESHPEESVRKRRRLNPPSTE